MIELQFLSGARAGQRLVLDEKPRLRLGRLPDNDVIFDAQHDLAVSGHHAELRRGTDGYYLIDLDSANGTFVGGVRVNVHRLASGQEIGFGPSGPRLLIRFLGGDPEAAAPPAAVPGTLAVAPAPLAVAPAPVQVEPPRQPSACPHCDATLRAGARFCARCGKDVGAEPAAAPRRWVLPLVIVLVCLFIAGGAVGAWFLLERHRAPERASEGTETVPRHYLELGVAVAPTGYHATTRVDGSGAEVTVGDGAVLSFAPGALPVRITVDVRRFDVALEWLYLDYALRARIYVIDSDADVPRFGGAVALRLPLPANGVDLYRWNGRSWSPLPRGAGNAAAGIEHLSRGELLVVERARPAGPAPNPVATKRSDIIRDYTKRADANPAVKAFYGVGETLSGRSHSDLCIDLGAMLKAQRGLTYDYPQGYNSWMHALPAQKDSLYNYLHDTGPGSLAGYFWEVTAPAMGPIRDALRARPPGSVAPSDMMKICLDAVNGNFPRAVLACHNALKHATMEGRNVGYQSLHTMPEMDGMIASRLIQWRTTDRSPFGDYDKMGCWYHLFAAMSAGVWAPTRYAGELAALGESGYRSSGSVGDVVDPEKGEADWCGAQRAIMALRFKPGTEGTYRRSDAGVGSRRPDAGVAATRDAGRRDASRRDAAAAPADSPDRLRVQAIDGRTREPLAGVKVALTSMKGRPLGSTTGDASGRFQIDAPPPGLKLIITHERCKPKLVNVPRGRGPLPRNEVPIPMACTAAPAKKGGPYVRPTLIGGRGGRRR